MIPVKIRNIEIGTGAPKICISNIGNTKEEIQLLTKRYVQLPIDVMEWRVDWFDQAMDTAEVLILTQELRSMLGSIPLLFTFRTKKEGGNMDISTNQYIALNLAVAESGFADLIDVEIFTLNERAQSLIQIIQQSDTAIIASSHNFEYTPTKADIISCLRTMQHSGADILKIAVMPNEKQDVLTLLSATEEMVRCYADRPIITISMGELGRTSRLLGGMFGSSITFGADVAPSAPGQLNVTELYTVLNVIY